MRDHVTDEVKLILRHAAIADLRSDADELAALVQALQRPFPSLPTDRAEREVALLVIALRARDQARRLLSLIGD